MRARCCLSLALALLVGTSGLVRADDAAARQVVEKGLKALGGAENVAKFKAASMKMKGTFHGMGTPIEYTGEYHIQIPNRVRMSLEFEVNNQKITFARIFNGEKGWISVAGMTQDLTADQITEAKEEMHAAYVTTLLPLVKEKGYTLASLGEAQVNGKPAAGVRVSSKGHRDVNLYFDKESGLPVKAEMRVKDDQTGQEVQQEEFLSDYKEFNGVKHALKMVIKREGKPYVEGETTEFKPLDTLDDGLFAKP